MNNEGRGSDRAHESPKLGRLGAGAVGALSLTALHQTGRYLRGDAPRMDTLGARAVVHLCKAAGVRPPKGKKLFLATLAGDLVANALYYAALQSGRARRTWMRGGLGGALAGVGALKLPQALGLGRAPRSRRKSNRLMTIALYAVGGLASAAVYGSLLRRTAD